MERLLSIGGLFVLAGLRVVRGPTAVSQAPNRSPGGTYAGVVSPERSNVCREGINRGAPDALQDRDPWHLL